MKNSKFKIKNLIYCLLIYFLSSQLNYVFAQFDRLAIGSRNTGLSHAVTALADDVYTIYSNPAGLGNIEWKEIGLDYDKLYWGLDDNSSLGNSFIAYAHSFKQWGTLGIGWLNFTLSGYYREDTFILAYGRQIQYSVANLPAGIKPILGIFETGRFKTGVKLKILSKEYMKTRYTENATNLDTGQPKGGIDPVFNNGYSRTGFSIDLGLLYNINSHHSLGLTLNDINQPDMGLSTEDKIYFGTKFGYAYKSENFNMATDVMFKQNNLILSGGVEKWFLNKTFALRSGLGVGTKEYTNLSLGGSWKYNGLFQLDYSFRYPLRGVSDFLGSHQVSLTMRFGAPVVKESVPESEIERLKLELETVKKLAEEYKLQAENIEKTYGDKDKIVREAREKQRIAEEKLKQVQEELQRVKMELKHKLSEEEKKKIIRHHWDLGISYYQKSEYENAIAEFKKILELNPGHRESQIRIKMAEEKLQEKYKLEAEKHYTAGLKAYHAGNLELAIKELESALSLDPENEEIRLLLERAKKEIRLKR